MLEIFSYDFMIRAFIAGIIIGTIAPIIGTFLVVKRYSLMSDALAHGSLIGVAIGVVMNIHPFITALFTSVITAFAIEKLREVKKIYADSVLAIFLSGSLSIAVIIFSYNKGLNINLLSYLFGSITTVSTNDIFLMLILGLVVLSLFIFLYKELYSICLDEELAQASGIAVYKINMILVFMAAITVSLAMRIVGILLIGALMVIPVISAMQLSKSFKQTIIYSIIFSQISIILGLFISYYFDLASGGTIVVVSIIIFIISLFSTKK